MAYGFILDTAIRDWVLIPLSVVMVLIGVLRYFVSKLMRSSQTPDPKIIKEGGREEGSEKETRLGLSYKKDENFGEWYSEVVVNSEMIAYHDISGCYALLPWTMSMWNIMKELFDAKIKKMKIKEAYFPLFVSKAAFEKEKDHIDGFAPKQLFLLSSVLTTPRRLGDTVTCL